MNLRLVCMLMWVLSLTGCAVLERNPKYNLANGTYTSKVLGEGNKKVFVYNSDDTIKVYALKRDKKKYSVDSLDNKPVSFPRQIKGSALTKTAFQQTSFDVDVLTIPFKYRFPTNGFPRQFTTQLNGGLYFGYRSDLYMLRYKGNPLGTGTAYINHIGISIGGFTGIGSTTMNPWVTRDGITSEYEGVAWSKGITAIAGINNLSAGLALGWDHLLDKNNVHWIYQGKPWIGLVLGLNLN